MSPGRGGRQNIRYISILPPLSEILVVGKITPGNKAQVKPQVKTDL